jgi:hypothetical protein
VKTFLKGWGFNLSGSRKKRKDEINVLIMELEKRKNAVPSLQSKKKKVWV